ncbi:M48 family metallopeptidase [Georgenia sp. SYP-B2076]|uniref:M48 family metallopeptidase n=1 Tax=Georgenia sp. SYP-B2076 TaxID=2495881 RepID=UPI0013DF24EC|nr:M48 family metalloprotease [Georgenia sp. SYP-B2076]
MHAVNGAHTSVIKARWGAGSILSIVLCLLMFVLLSTYSGLWFLLPVPLVVFAWRWFSARNESSLASVNAVPADPIGHAPLLGHVQAAAERLGIAMPAVYVSPQPVLNAFATTDREGGAICLFQATIDALPDDELAAVVAHEVGHLKNRDSAYMTFFDAVRWSLTAIIAVLGVIVVVCMAVLAMFSRSARGALGLSTAFVGALTALGAGAAYLLVTAGQRSREFMADRLAAQVHPDPLALGRALQRMASASRRWRVGEVPASVAALCIVQPFVPGFLSSIVSSHPSTDRRIKRLERLVGAERAIESNGAAAARDWDHAHAALEAQVAHARNAQPSEIVGPAPFAPMRNEQVWATIPAKLVKPRTRQGQLSFIVADDGVAVLTTARVVFSGPAGRTEWRWDKAYDHSWRSGVLGGDAVLIQVTNRQKPSGLQFALQHAGGARLALELALAESRGSRADLVAHLEAQVREHERRRPASVEG